MNETRYKFIELSVVTEDSLEDTVNHWVGQGWKLDAIRFVTGEGSRRPTMAFVSFVQDAGIRRDPSSAPPISRERRPSWEGVEPSRVHKVLELGELDLGEALPLEAEIDWASARRPRARTAPGIGPEAAGKKRRPKRRT